MSLEGLIEKYAWFIDFALWGTIASIVVAIIIAIAIIAIIIKQGIGRKKRLAEFMRDFENSGQRVTESLRKIDEKFNKGL